ncbi:RlpA-like double-psi beta-barrel-protein domain-containing protein-containing protein, partial [Sparassis latifolia]
TWYETGLGACGITNTDANPIVAVSKLLFDTYPGYTGSDPNSNPVCNKQIAASYGGNTVTLTVTDRCEACAETSLDLAPSAFEVLAPLGSGRLTGMTWQWV